MQFTFFSPAIPSEIIEDAERIATILHSAILRKLSQKIVEVVREKGNLEQLVGLWKAAKGRWISWDDQ